MRSQQTCTHAYLLTQQIFAYLHARKRLMIKFSTLYHDSYTLSSKLAPRFPFSTHLHPIVHPSSLTCVIVLKKKTVQANWGDVRP